MFSSSLIGAEIRSVCTEAGMFAIRSRRKVSTKGCLILLPKNSSGSAHHDVVRNIKQARLAKNKPGCS